MGVVAALHVGVLYVIAQSLGLAPSLSTPEPIVIKVIDEPPRIEPPPEPVEYQPRQNTLVLPVPDLPPTASDPVETITAPPADPTDTRPQQPEIFAGPPVTAVRLDSRYPLTQPPYPPRDIREGNTGTADIEVYVLPSGRVGDARIVTSTGFEGLDRSALAEAKRNWRLQPATRDGVPFAQWHRLRVTFKLNQQR
jgi:protein TonB